jgi:hypothetical protein
LFEGGAPRDERRGGGYGGGVGDVGVAVVAVDPCA